MSGMYSVLNRLCVVLSHSIIILFGNKFVISHLYLFRLRCGSLIVDLALKFSSTVRESKVLFTLRNAAKNGMLGDFNVSASSIIGTRLERETTTATTATTAPTSSPYSKWP